MREMSRHANARVRSDASCVNKARGLIFVKSFIEFMNPADAIHGSQILVVCP
jgi:hypothetical protein